MRSLTPPSPSTHMKYKKYILLAPALKQKRMPLSKKILMTLFAITIVVGFTRGQIEFKAATGSAQAEEVSNATSTEEYAPCLKLADHQFFCGDDAGKDSKIKDLYNENQALKTSVKKATISFYTSEVRQTDSSPEIAANGQNIWTLYKQGLNTCASNDYKFGTKLSIVGVGDCVVRDRMNDRYTGKGRIDWYLGYSHGEAWQNGLMKNVTVYVEKN